jgi:O-antigen ligase
MSIEGILPADPPLPAQALAALAWTGTLAFCVSLPLWEAPKNLALGVALAALLGARAWEGRRPAWDGLCWGLSAYAATRLLSALFSGTPAYSLAQVTGELKMAAVYFLFLNLVSNLRRARPVASLLMAATVAALLCAVVRARPSNAMLTLGSVGYGNAVGIFLALSMPLPASILSTAEEDARLRGLAAVALALFAGGMFVSMSRTAILATLVFFAWLVWRAGCRPAKAHLAAILAGLGAALVVIFLMIPAVQYKLLDPIGNLLYTARVRAEIWSGAWQVFLAHPWLGCGPGNYASCPEAVSSVHAVHAHSIYLHALSETGLVGLAGLLAFLLPAWRKLRRLAPVLAAGGAQAYWSAAGGAFLIIVVMGLSEMVLNDEHALLLVCLLGMASGLGRHGAGPEAGPVAAGWRRPFSGSP